MTVPVAVVVEVGAIVAGWVAGGRVDPGLAVTAVAVDPTTVPALPVPGWPDDWGDDEGSPDEVTGAGVWVAVVFEFDGRPEARRTSVEVVGVPVPQAAASRIVRTGTIPILVRRTAGDAGSSPIGGAAPLGCCLPPGGSRTHAEEAQWVLDLRGSWFVVVGPSRRGRRPG